MISKQHWKYFSALVLLLLISQVFYKTNAQSNQQPELPRILLDTTYVVPTGQTINVAAGGNLQAALNAANPGDTVALEAGATFVGNFTLPNKAGSAWIVVRTSAESSLPAPGLRIGPASSSAMPKLISPNAAPVVTALTGAHHFRFIGIEFGVASAVSINYGLISLGGSNQTSLEQVPHDFVLDRCYVHGNNVGDVSRGVALNCVRGAVIDSYIANIHGVGFDTQALAAWNTPGPLKVVNNYLEGAGENVLFGGVDPAIFGLVVSDIEFKRNHLAKPLSWNPLEPGYGGTHWSVKNIFELKNAQRVLIDGNIFEYNWIDGQNGTAILFTPRNQEGGAPWCVVQDVTFTNNIVRHTAAAINILGNDDIHSAQPLQRIKIKNNLLVDVGNSRWGGSGILFYLLDATAYVTIDHNTAFHSGNIITTEGRQHTSLVYTNNLTPHNLYGVIGSGYGPGNPSLNAYFPACTFAKNILAGGSASIYPTNNFFPPSLDAVGFIDRAGENYRLSITSLYKNAGTDGKDIGADIDAIEDAISDSTPPGNRPPVVTISSSATSGIAPLALSLTGIAIDADGQVVTYDWDFGDGQSAASAVVSHMYQSTGTYTINLTVTDNLGATAKTSLDINVTNTRPTDDIVLYAAEAPMRIGKWKVVGDSTAAGGSRLLNVDLGSSKLSSPLIKPKHYVEMTFYAEAGAPYRLWVRGKADNNSPYNDSFYVQFSDSVDAANNPVYLTNTTDATVINLKIVRDAACRAGAGKITAGALA